MACTTCFLLKNKCYRATQAKGETGEAHQAGCQKNETSDTLKHEQQYHRQFAKDKKSDFYAHGNQ